MNECFPDTICQHFSAIRCKADWREMRLEGKKEKEGGDESKVCDSITHNVQFNAKMPNDFLGRLFNKVT